MKRQKRVLVGVILIAFLLGFFAVNNAFAEWSSNATILWVQVTDDGDYAIRVQWGTWTKTFLVDTTLANGKAILAVALAAVTTDKTVTIEYSGNYILNIYLLAG